MINRYIFFSWAAFILAIITFSFPDIVLHSQNISRAYFDATSKNKTISNLTEITIKDTILPKSIKINGIFTIKKSDFSQPYMDVFQTDSKNNGIRYEVGKQPNGSYYSAIALYDKKLPEHIFTISIGNPPAILWPNKKYKIFIEINSTKQISYVLKEIKNNKEEFIDSNKITNKFTSFKVRKVKIGSGYDDSRKFVGIIENFNIEIKSYLYTATYSPYLTLTFLLLFIVACLYNNKKQNINSNKKFKLSYLIASIMIFNYPLLQLYSINLTTVNIITIIKHFTSLSLIATILFFILKKIYNSHNKTLIIITLLAFISFFSGRAYNILSPWITPNLFIFITLFILFIIHNIIYLSNKNFHFASYLKIIIYLLFSMSIISILFYFVKNEEKSQTTINQKKVDPIKKTYKPDIYFIITDMHASQRSIYRHLQYNNQPFINKLNSLGFYIPNNSYSNYPYTVLSLPSMLNLAYLPKKINSISQIDAIYDKNALAQILKKYGYKYIFISPRNIMIEKSQIADFNFTCSKITDFDAVLWSYSLFFRENKMGKTYRHDVICGINAIKKSVSYKGPKFVFAHILSPHPPYVFTENGGTVLLDKQLDTRVNINLIKLNKQSYLEQLKYIENQLYTLAEFILKNSKEPPIIIIQGDHGFSLFSTPELSSGKLIPSAEYIQARMGVLGAYYFPKGGKVILYDTISPINVTRGLLRYYFKRNDLNQLADLSYWVAETNLFQMQNVTHITHIKA